MASLNTYISSLFSSTPSYSSLSGLKGTTPSLSLPSLTQQKKTTSQPTPNNPSAASTVSTTPTPAQNTAKNQYVNSLAAPTTPQLGTPEYTQYLLNKASTLGINTDGFNSQPSTSPVAAPPAAPTPEPTPMDKYLESYRDYLAQYADSLKPSDELKAARSRLSEIQSKIDERSLKARRDYEATLDTPGMLKGGAEQAANKLSRRYASELADLGVAESGAARGLSALTADSEAFSNALRTALELGQPLDIGGNLYDPRTGEMIYEKPQEAAEGFTLSPGQTRFDAEGNPIASGGPRQMSDAEITKALERQEKDTMARDTQAQTVGLISSLLNSPQLSTITGLTANSALAFLSGASRQVTAEARAQAAQLKALTSLEGREKLKGSGAISDFEAGMLADSANSLNFAIQDDGRILMPQSQVEQNLKNMRGVLQLKAGLPATAVITNPSTGETIRATLTRQEAQDLYIQGILIDFL